jgi:DNA-binding CsgD family transcriptional regulator
MSTPKDFPRIAPLTRSQSQLIPHIAMGLGTMEVAEVLAVGKQAVGTQVRNMMQALKLASRQSLVEWCRKHAETVAKQEATNNADFEIVRQFWPLLPADVRRKITKMVRDVINAKG